MAEKVSRRRFIKTASATAAGVYGLSKAGSEGIAKAAPPVGSAAPPPPVQPRVPLARRPNVLVILGDEDRFPPVYETQELKDWRTTYLTAQEQMRETVWSS